MNLAHQDPKGEPTAPLISHSCVWSAGAWFGTLFGVSAWLLIGSPIPAPASAPLGILWPVCGVSIVAAGSMLWARRRVLFPYVGLMILLLITWMATCVAIVGLMVLGPKSAVPFEVNPWQALSGLLMVPMLMLMFTLRERAGEKRPEAPCPESSKS